MKRWPLVLAGLIVGASAGTWVTGTLLQGQAPVAAPAPAIPAELTSYRDIVKRVLPAVVSIESRGKARRPARKRSGPIEDQQLPEEFRRFFEGGPGDDESRGGPTQMGMGSGFVVDAKGVILTNFHVVDGADTVEVLLRDGRKFISKNVKSDPKTDLAIVRIDAKDLPFLEFGDSLSMEIGDRVLAVGAPFGLTGSVTHGIISAKGRSLRVNMYEDFLQTDAAINPGNSGGPLVNLEGKVIGINSAIKSRSGGFQGVGLAIASNLAKNVMDQLLKNGIVRRGYLGIQISDVVGEEVAKKLGLKEAAGVLVTQVFETGPAAKGGLKDGDVIVSLSGRAVKESRELQAIVAGLPVGKPAEVNVVRDGKPVTLKITIEEQPQQIGASRGPVRKPEAEGEGLALDKIGIEAVDLTPESAQRLGFKEGAKGVLITRVDPDGVAAGGGLRRGMLITKVDRKSVTSVKALGEMLTAGSLASGILLQFQSPQGVTKTVLLRVVEKEG